MPTLLTWLSTIACLQSELFFAADGLVLDARGTTGFQQLRIEQVHLAATKHFGEVVVAYASQVQSDSPFVAYRFGDDDEWRQTKGNYTHFHEGNPKGVRHLYRAKLANLPPLSKVLYKACISANKINNTDGLCSDEFSFTTLGDAANSSKPMQTRLLFVADLGSGINSLGQSLMTSLPSLEQEVLHGSGADAVLHIGDIGYDLHSDGGARGDLFMNRMEPVAARTFYQTVPGNHERMADDSFAQYRARFHMPAASAGDKSPSSDSPFKLWWSTDINNVHITALNTEVFHRAPKKLAREMMAWLRKDLEAANERRHLQPWVVLLGHRPSYCSEPSGWCQRMGTTGPEFQDEFESLLHEHKVDLALWGHQHVYERSWPVFNRTVAAKHYRSPAAPVHIVTGAAGNTFDFLAVSRESVLEPDGDWSAFLDGGRLHVCSYGRLFAANSTHLQVEQVNGLTGSVMDEIWMTKSSIDEDKEHRQI